MLRYENMSLGNSQSAWAAWQALGCVFKAGQRRAIVPKNDASMIQDIIFDLDGTLIDSLPGIERAIASAWNARFPGKPLPNLKPLLGPPIRKIFLAINPDLSIEDLEPLAAHFRKLYDTEYCLDSTLFPGCREVLERLLARQKRLYVATNKPTKPTAKILDHLKLTPFFAEIVSLDSQNPPYSGKTEMIQAILSHHSLCHATTVMIGDGLEDGTAAGECKIGFISARYGYGDIHTRQFPHGLFDMEAISDFPKLIEAL